MCDSIASPVFGVDGDAVDGRAVKQNVSGLRIYHIFSEINSPPPCNDVTRGVVVMQDLAWLAGHRLAHQFASEPGIGATVGKDLNRIVLHRRHETNVAG